MRARDMEFAGGVGTRPLQVAGAQPGGAHGLPWRSWRWSNARFESEQVGVAMKQRKSELRDRVLGYRNAMAPAERQRLSEQITARVLSTPAYGASRTVLAYSNFGSELATGGFAGAVLASGRTLVLPRVNRSTRRLDLYRVGDRDRELVAGSWGIVEPDPGRCEPVDPGQVDFVLVPGVAFDPAGARIGYGGGFYDKLFEACVALGRRPYMLAPAFGCQIVDAVPLEAHDIRVDLVVTEAGCFPL